jgi:hypothetical protein
VRTRNVAFPRRNVDVRTRNVAFPRRNVAVQTRNVAFMRAIATFLSCSVDGLTRKASKIVVSVTFPRARTSLPRSFATFRSCIATFLRRNDTKLGRKVTKLPCFVAFARTKASRLEGPSTLLEARARGGEPQGNRAASLRMRRVQLDRNQVSRPPRTDTFDMSAGAAVMCVAARRRRGFPVASSAGSPSSGKSRSRRRDHRFLVPRPSREGCSSGSRPTS